MQLSLLGFIVIVWLLINIVHSEDINSKKSVALLPDEKESDVDAIEKNEIYEGKYQNLEDTNSFDDADNENKKNVEKSRQGRTTFVKTIFANPNRTAIQLLADRFASNDSKKSSKIEKVGDVRLHREHFHSKHRPNGKTRNKIAKSRRKSKHRTSSRLKQSKKRKKHELRNRRAQNHRLKVQVPAKISEKQEENSDGFINKHSDDKDTYQKRLIKSSVFPDSKSIDYDTAQVSSFSRKNNNVRNNTSFKENTNNKSFKEESMVEKLMRTTTRDPKRKKSGDQGVEYSEYYNENDISDDPSMITQIKSEETPIRSSRDISNASSLYDYDFDDRFQTQPRSFKRNTNLDRSVKDNESDDNYSFENVDYIYDYPTELIGKSKPTVFSDSDVDRTDNNNYIPDNVSQQKSRNRHRKVLGKNKQNSKLSKKNSQSSNTANEHRRAHNKIITDKGRNDNDYNDYNDDQELNPIFPSAPIRERLLKSNQDRSQKDYRMENDPMSPDEQMDHSKFVRTNKKVKKGKRKKLYEKSNGLRNDKFKNKIMKDSMSAKIAENVNTNIEATRDMPTMINVTKEVANQILDRIVDELEGLKVEASKNDVKEGMPCKVNGSWMTTQAGVRIDIKRYKRRIIVSLAALPSQSTRQSFINTTWNITGTIPLKRGGPFSLIASNNDVKSLAVFVGACRTCHGMDTIEGVWTIAHDPKDCRDFPMATAVYNDVFRKMNLLAEIKQAVKEKQQVIQQSETTCSDNETSSTTANSL